MFLVITQNLIMQNGTWGRFHLLRGENKSKLIRLMFLIKNDFAQYI